MCWRGHNAGAARPAAAVLAVVIVSCLPSTALCIGDNFNFNSPALGFVVAMLLTGIALLCSPLVGLLTWVSATLVRVEGVGFGRAYLVALAEVALSSVALASTAVYGSSQALLGGIEASVVIAAWMIAAIAIAKRVFRTTWTKATATCLLSWALVALLLVLVFIREVADWLSWQLSSLR